MVTASTLNVVLIDSPIPSATPISPVCDTVSPK